MSAGKVIVTIAPTGGGINGDMGRLANDVELVERIVRIIREFGLEPATPAEALEIIGLPQLKEA